MVLVEDPPSEKHSDMDSGPLFCFFLLAKRIANNIAVGKNKF